MVDLGRRGGLPLTLPHFDDFDMPSKVGRVLFRVGQKHRHRLTVQGVSFLAILVTFRTTVPETSVKLIGGARPCTPPIDTELVDTLLAVISLMTDCASGLTGLPSQLLHGHLTRLRLLRPELLFLIDCIRHRLCVSHCLELYPP